MQLLFYATPIIYPIGFLPPWARTIVFLNPLTQVLQDVRAIVLYPDIVPEPDHGRPGYSMVTAARLLPISIAIGIFFLGLHVFRRESPWFAERV